jgi:hypothetical protein
MAKGSGEQRRSGLLEWDDTKGTPKNENHTIRVRQNLRKIQ